MKNGKIFLSLALLALLGLGACSGQKPSSSSASHEESGSEKSSESEGGSSSSESSSEHTHTMVFDSFVWNTEVGNYTAQAKYVCSDNDGHEEFHDAVMSTTAHTDPLCDVDGSTTWKASYDSHEETKDETIEALGHVWGEPVWDWTSTLDYSSVTATFTCTRNNEHAHVETATKAGGTVVKFEDVPASCTENGHISYRATVQFNNQQYQDEKTDIVYAEGHPDADAYGFCTECEEYIGEDINNYWEPQPISNVLSGAVFYYRFVLEEGYDYKLVTTDLNASWFSFYGVVSEAWTTINIGTDFTTVTIPDDGAVYMVFENGSSHNVTGSFYIDYICNHPEGPNEYGFCEDCNEYLGMTITSAQWNTEIEMPARGIDEYWYFRVETDDDHHITLYENQDYTGHDDIEECYYVNNADDVTDLGQISPSDFNGLHDGSPTSIKDFFTTMKWDSDGYLYVVLQNVSQDSFGDGDLTIIASTEHFADEHGYCAIECGEYLGTTVTAAKFNTDQQFNWNKNVPVFYRFEEIYRANGSSSTYEYVEYQFASIDSAYLKYFSIYYVKGGVWKSAELSDSAWCQLPEHPDADNPYIYLVFTYTGSGAHSVCNFRLNYQI